MGEGVAQAPPIEFAKGGRSCARSGITAHSDLPACAGCGACCHLVVELRPGDHVPPELVTEHDGKRCMEQRGNGACVALDPVTRLCTIYDHRPQTCRDFNRGDGVCLWVLEQVKENAARRATAAAV